MSHDPFVAQALDARRQCRADFEDYRLAEYARAEDACRGALLNRRGRDAGLDALDLFMGNEARAQAYASDELKEWWRDNGRPTFQRWAEQNAWNFFGAVA